MKITRKDFLRLLGGSALAAGAGKLVQIATSPEVSAATEAPSPKKRWGMVIDLQKCANEPDCDKCLQACHVTHNVPHVPNPAQEVKWVWKEPFENVFPYQQTDYTRQAFAGKMLPVLCNQCAEPACVRVCPTQATWKRDDGIVMMDYHRCIGCRYCMAACPYGSRSFNWVDPRPYIEKPTSEYPTRTQGVVEKCDFCAERLDQRMGPACVEACPQKALVFGDLNDENSEIRQVLRKRFAIQRRPELGTGPAVFYLV
jgi:Fe-S-cluster-containing dehydrogenase component